MENICHYPITRDIKQFHKQSATPPLLVLFRLPPRDKETKIEHCFWTMSADHEQKDTALIRTKTDIPFSSENLMYLSLAILY